MIATRIFTQADQRAFAQWSGDTNPMHMDALAARRTQAGEQVVHGIHVLLWLLDSIAAHLPLHSLQQIKIQFTKFVYLGHEVGVDIKQSDAASARIVVVDAGLTTMTVALRFAPRATTAEWQGGTDPAPAGAPSTPSLEQMAALGGWLAPPVAADVFAHHFPHAAAAIGARRLSGLAQSSRLVGMICPGLHSIYASLSVDLTDPIGGPDGIGFRTRKVDDRFRRVDMDVLGAGLAGQVSTFARHPPIDAPDMRHITRHVTPGEFAGTTALVAGGSRGLGAITAQLIAAGGGHAVITYASGHTDADNLCAQINAAIGQTVCTASPLDALQPVAPQLGGLAGQITQLYYLATPQIFVQKTALFQPELYARFSRVYVDAFYEACTSLMPGLLAAFYPSSVAVEARPKGMTEYSMAKSAGEMLCADMMAGMKGLRILIDRLPRILTDQTATVASAESADPVAVMLPLIRRLHDG